ncbi:MAG: histidine phosphatase family protein [Planctomycetes bacterium]|nr:histidine phosphatase family protein [Planctomycetota bacterium]
MRIDPRPQIWVIRHAETEWSLNGRHTGRTDIPLTARGDEAARELKPWIDKVAFGTVLSSPRARALRTADLCGLGKQVAIEPLLAEWDYGDFEGWTSLEIAAKNPGWDLWHNGCPGGEQLSDVHDRAEQLLDRCRDMTGNIALFTHGHFARVLIATWLELPVTRGRSFAIRAGSVNVLGWEHINKVIWSMGAVPSGPGVGR